MRQHISNLGTLKKPNSRANSHQRPLLGAIKKLVDSFLPDDDNSDHVDHPAVLDASHSPRTRERVRIRIIAVLTASSDIMSPHPTSPPPPPPAQDNPSPKDLSSKKDTSQQHQIDPALSGPGGDPRSHQNTHQSPPNGHNANHVTSDAPPPPVPLTYHPNPFSLDNRWVRQTLPSPISVQTDISFPSPPFHHFLLASHYGISRYSSNPLPLLTSLLVSAQQYFNLPGTPSIITITLLLPPLPLIIITIQIPIRIIICLTASIPKIGLDLSATDKTTARRTISTRLVLTHHRRLSRHYITRPPNP
ncbi:hypothetical protein BDY19DRAFT_747778 [Irpex rosettiformis]|uniref:Uncharacterized protein n=1 Tax=Irpex rosettiformis TaxID=378272 RepID=A0ACB8TMD3_9APHY|nr:hypothetical protein BDY19DRAFT_747778 [Irpex rosettiformis]